MLSKLKLNLQDFSASTITAGLVANLVGYASSAVLVFQAATVAGATPDQASSWLGILCVSMGILTVILSLYYRTPIMFAWSTAGSALLITSLQGVPLSDAVGAFLLSAFLIVLCGISGSVEKIMKHIPTSIASAMLAGVLLRFGMDVFLSLKTQAILAFTMFAIYILSRRFNPRYAVMLALFGGCLTAKALGLLHFENLTTNLAIPQFTAPTFSLSALVGIGLPLFVVTMTSQNMTGIAILRAFGYSHLPMSKLITWSGLTNFIIAPFGGFAMNLSAITAAICMSPEAHPDPTKRYTGAVTSGLFYILIGLFSGFVTSLFAAFPKELVLSIAGLALFGTIGQSLNSALEKESEREAALITFITTASGVSIFGIGAAFWGLVTGALAAFVLKYRRQRS